MSIIAPANYVTFDCHAAGDPLVGADLLKGSHGRPGLPERRVSSTFVKPLLLGFKTTKIQSVSEARFSSLASITVLR